MILWGKKKKRERRGVKKTVWTDTHCHFPVFKRQINLYPCCSERSHFTCTGARPCQFARTLWPMVALPPGWGGGGSFFYLPPHSFWGSSDVCWGARTDLGRWCQDLVLEREHCTAAMFPTFGPAYNCPDRKIIPLGLLGSEAGQSPRHKGNSPEAQVI